MNNPCEKTEVWVVDSFVLDKYIAFCLGLPKFFGMHEASNDSAHEFSVTASPLKDKWDKDHLAKIIADAECEHYALGTVLDELCRRGQLHEGNYIVSVCW